MDIGDIWHVDLEPTVGREQSKARYVLVISPRAFNQLGTPLIAPIATGGEFARAKGWAVSMSGAGTRATGVVLCHQIRTLDIQARRGRFVEKAPPFIVEEVLARLSSLFD